jgi:FkbM family methyltransferase
MASRQAQARAHSTAPATQECSASTLESSLREILREPIFSVKHRESRAFDQLLERAGNRIVLFGAGNFGRRALHALKSAGVHPLAISDNNKALWGTTLDGTPLLSPQDAAALYGKDSLFIVTIRNDRHWYKQSLKQLTSLGCASVSSVNPACWNLSETLPPFLLYDLPHKLYEQADQVLLGAKVWDDDVSRATYLANIRLRALDDLCGLPEPPAGHAYFLERVFEVEPGEAVLDCGAFDGDTIRSLMAQQPDFGSIDAVEADSNSYEKLSAYVSSLEPDVRNRIRLHQYAIGAERGTVRFENTGDTSSKLSDTGGTLVELKPIDELCANTKITMLKMDIEGAEHGGLLGGKSVIQRDRPILAICVYHSQEDIWRLPLLMREMLSGYRLYLRSHGGDGIETVAYAVPSERALNTLHPLSGDR